MDITLEYIYDSDTSIQYTHTITIYRAQYSDLLLYREWLCENLGVNDSWILSSRSDHDMLYLKTLEDAMAFKLRWI